MTKLAPDFNFPKISMVIEDYWVLARIDGETADFQKKMAIISLKWPKIDILWK